MKPITNDDRADVLQRLLNLMREIEKYSKKTPEQNIVLELILLKKELDYYKNLNQNDKNALSNAIKEQFIKSRPAEEQTDPSKIKLVDINDIITDLDKKSDQLINDKVTSWKQDFYQCQSTFSQITETLQPENINYRDILKLRKNLELMENLLGNVPKEHIQSLIDFSSFYKDVDNKDIYDIMYQMTIDIKSTKETLRRFEEGFYKQPATVFLSQMDNAITEIKEKATADLTSIRMRNKASDPKQYKTSLERSIENNMNELRKIQKELASLTERLLHNRNKTDNTSDINKQFIALNKLLGEAQKAIQETAQRIEHGINPSITPQRHTPPSR